MKEYWPESITKKSWERLILLKNEFDFILIGGWAIYLYTHLHKSKDIDIIVDLPTLYTIREKYTLIKNERLRKYEIREDNFDIDIYTPFFSDIGLKIEEILKMNPVIIEGIKVVQPEVLLFLKLHAFQDRKGSVKGGKDAIDIVGLLYKVDMNFKKFLSLGNVNYTKELLLILKAFKDWEYLGLDYITYKRWQKNIIEKLSKYL